MFKRFLGKSRAFSGTVSSVAVAALSFMACGGTGGGASPDLQMPDLAVPPDLSLVDTKAPDYPKGSDTGEVDKIMPNFTFQGHWRPKETAGLSTSAPFGEVSFQMI